MPSVTSTQAVAAEKQPEREPYQPIECCWDEATLWAFLALVALLFCLVSIGRSARAEAGSLQDDILAGLEVVGQIRGSHRQGLPRHFLT